MELMNKMCVFIGIWFLIVTLMVGSGPLFWVSGIISIALFATPCLDYAFSSFRAYGYAEKAIFYSYNEVVFRILESSQKRKHEQFKEHIDILKNECSNDPFNLVEINMLTRFSEVTKDFAVEYDSSAAHCNKRSKYFLNLIELEGYADEKMERFINDQINYLIHKNPFLGLVKRGMYCDPNWLRTTIIKVES